MSWLWQHLWQALGTAIGVVLLPPLANIVISVMMRASNRMGFPYYQQGTLFYSLVSKQSGHEYGPARLVKLNWLTVELDCLGGRFTPKKWRFQRMDKIRAKDQ